MKEIKEQELLHPVESNLLIDLVEGQYIAIGEKKTARKVFDDLIKKIENLTRGTYGK